MDFISYCINKPVSVAVGVILVLLFGFIGLKKLPVQLTPDVEEPQITVSTTWYGATPYEMEKNIVEKQEDALKGLRGLTLMESACYNSYCDITLTFKVGTNLDDALLRVSNKLNEVSDYPENVDRPKIDATGSQSSPIIWMMLKTKNEDKSIINTYRTFFENNVRQYLERVPGVGSLFIFGGTDKQLEIVIDPKKVASYHLTIEDIIARIRSANSNISAGTLGVSKMNYRIRSISEYQNVNDPMDVLLFNDGLQKVYLKDVAFTRFGYATNDVAVMQNGDPVIVIGIRREEGANVIDLTKDVRKVVESLNKGILKDNDLYIHWVYDQVPYIETSINIVKNNVIFGSILAVIVLFLFLRSISSTLTIALSIPISAIGTFIFMWIFGRNFNVVSLAGISFAVGMLVDNSIVVLENIDRHRGMGKSPFQASYDGAKEVWGAVLASTATTLAVFLPVIFIKEEAGQLFKDIAIAISFSILLSFFVSVTVIPTISDILYRMADMASKKQANTNIKIIHPIQYFNKIGSFFINFLMRFVNLSIKNWFTRLCTIFVMVSISVIMVLFLAPKAEYLPQGNRNLVLNILIPPPGYSVEKRNEIGNYIFKTAKPYFETDYKDGIPKIKNIFYVAADRITIFGAISEHETEARNMIPLFTKIINSIPGIFGASLQAGIFESRIGRGRTVEVRLSGENVDEIIGCARILFGAIGAKIAGAQIRPVPSLEISYPEANIIPNRAKVLANGLTEDAVGTYIDILMDGRKIDEFKPAGAKNIDLVVRSDAEIIKTPEDIMNSQITNRFSDLITINTIADLKYSYGMTQINHVERKRNITLEVTPPDHLPLQQAMEIIENDVVASLRQAGQLNGVDVHIGGNADKLTQTRKALQWNFILAVVITYLLMSALLENFFYPLIILFSIPLGAAGGFLGIWLVNRFIALQSFDVITMLGFIILVGTVVNNAILIVYQSINNVRYEGITGLSAISESVRTRLRPIFMTTTTSVIGLSPLVLTTGPGSELYRGLGSVLLGGLMVSTIFTLFLIPSLLAFFIKFEKIRK